MTRVKHEVLDTRKAFQPGSGYFGWMLVPHAKVIVEGDVNHKQKVIDAIRDLEAQQKDVATQRQRLAATEIAKRDAEQHLIRTLHAVYGGRAAAGVVLRGTRYSLEHAASGVDDYVLVIGEADFEVLG